MKLWSWKTLLPLMLILVLAVAAACGDDDDDDGDGGGGGGGGGPTPDAEQVLNVNLTGEPQSLDPQRATDVVSLTVLNSLYSPLLMLDEESNLEPALAEEIPTIENGGISEDGLTYTFKLRDDLVWDDGEPLVAQAFVDGAKRLFEPGSGNFYVDFYRVLAAGGKNMEAQEALAEGVEGAALEAIEQAVVENLEVTAPDDQTVVYKLNRRSPVFLLLTTMWPLYPVRQDIIDANGDAWTEAGTHVSNGAFKLDEWNHNESISLVRNDNWYGGQAKLERINFDMIEDAAIAFLAYQEGELDSVVLGPAELVQVRGTDFENEFHSYAELVTLGIYFNFDDPNLANQKVRQALTGAFDREEYAEIVREGAVLPAYSWLPPGIPGYDDEVGRQYQDAVEKSQALLAESGVEDLEIEILTNDGSTAQLTAEWLKDQWETNLGITVTINVLETATYFAERNAGNYQVVSGGWGADYPDPQNWMPLFQTGGLLNSGNFSSARYDELIAMADEELDNDRRIEIYQEAQVVFMEELPFAPMNFRRRNALVKPYVQGIVFSPREFQIPGDLSFAKIFISGKE